MLTACVDGALEELGAGESLNYVYPPEVLQAVMQEADAILKGVEAQTT